MPADRPNIIVVTTDQQRTDTLGCYGSSFVRTPNIDGLARQGMRFDRAYTCSPVCTPSRVSLFSGQLPSRHGAWNVGVNYRGGDLALPRQLCDAGYQTHNIGKAHFQAFGGGFDESIESLGAWQKRFPAFNGPYFGFEKVELSLGHTTFGVAGHYGAWVRDQVTRAQFDEFHRAKNNGEFYFGGNAFDWSMPTRLHSSVWTADRVISFLKSRDTNRPFMLAIGFQDPHHPHALPHDFHDRVDPAAVPLPDFTPGELDDKPPHFGQAHRGELETSPFRGDYQVAGQSGSIDYRKVSESQARAGRAYYHSMVQLIDAQMGRILATLDELNLTQNTIVVFTTDHGEMLGDHGLWMKGPFHYEQLVRVPLIVRWPGALRAGRATSSLYSHVDLTPTLLSAAGVKAATPMDGVDLTPLLRGDAEQVREVAIVECVDDPRCLRLKTAVTQTRKLTWYAGQTFGELYDLEKDPAEKINRWNDPAYAADRASLLGTLLANQESLETRSPRHCYA